MTLGASTSAAGDAIDFVMDAERRWEQACFAAELLAVDPSGLGGAHIKAGPGPARDRWLDLYRTAAGGARVESVPASADHAAWEGGLDLVATLTEGHAVHRNGILPADGILVIRMAEQISRVAAHTLGRRLDDAAGPSVLILFDEGDEGAGNLRPLKERVAFELCLDGIPLAFTIEGGVDPQRVMRARKMLSSVTIADRLIGVIGKACLSCGVTSIGTQNFVVRAAIGLAALAGRKAVEAEDVTTAAKLVLPARAEPQAETEEPAEAEDGEHEPAPEENLSEPDRAEPEESEEDSSGREEALTDEELEEIITEAIQSGTVSFDHTAKLGLNRKDRIRSSGRFGASARSTRDGRPMGAVPGNPRTSGRIDVLATLRAAAPWQKLRPAPSGAMPVRVYPSDFRVKRFVHKSGSCVIFVVDASGSSAMNRLAEAKGAVEHLLSECYSRRDMVGLVTFRGTAAERVLPPSRSLTRARRAMAGLPGGGGTPLASAIELALSTALSERHEGRRPLLVFLSDGRGNIDLSGVADRTSAADQTEHLASLVASQGIDALFFDISPRPNDRARTLAAKMAANYVPLPYADQDRVSTAVNAERRDLQRRGA